MASTDFLPAREAELVTWSANFNTRINLTPLLFGLSAAQATAFGVLNDAFVDSYTIAASDATNSTAARLTKKNAKVALIANARELAAIVQAFPGTTDAMRAELGLTVPAQPVPTPIPAEIPVVEISSRMGNVVTLKLHDGSGSRRGRPASVAGASVFSFIGAAPPVNVQDWTFQGLTGKTLVDITFAPTVPAGTVVWFTCFWFNSLNQSGAGCAPISTIIAGGAMQQAA